MPLAGIGLLKPIEDARKGVEAIEAKLRKITPNEDNVMELNHIRKLQKKIKVLKRQERNSSACIGLM